MSSRSGHPEKLNSYFSDLERSNATTSLPMDYVLKNKEGKRLFILLHGYSQWATKFLNHVEPLIPKDACILAPNGLFVMPRREGEKYLVGFSWFFYDNFTDEYLVDQQPSALALKSLMENLGLTQKKTTIIGYSQGGYLSPFVAEKLPQVDKVIGISCEFLKDEIAKPEYEIFGIHGENDEIVDPKPALDSHQNLLSGGAKGTFTMVKGEGHKLSPILLEPLKKLLE